MPLAAPFPASASLDLGAAIDRTQGGSGFGTSGDLASRNPASGNLEGQTGSLSTWEEDEVHDGFSSTGGGSDESRGGHRDRAAETAEHHGIGFPGLVFVQPGAREFHSARCPLLWQGESARAIRMSRKEAEESGYHPCDECLGE